ncbi:MAG TPA: cbb3-type cytochrome c oxidase subunit I [Pseudolabrys sp.]|nr:cbb3-type cytochrome c oxidase subunit I [Pseudolabrys sp.]
MTAITVVDLPRPRPASYLSDGHTVWSWITTTDHKRIGILYALSITVFFFTAGVAIGLVRLELLEPHGLFLSDDQYNRLFTLHGIVMVWFFLVPSIPATLGNFLLPLMIGTTDVSFPRLNLLSWYLFTIGGIFTIYTIWAGGVDTGWTFYTPFSTMFSNGHVIAAAAGVFIVGFSSIATGVNFITTTHMMRAPGMTWFRLPLMVWALYATSLVMVLATPVLAMSLLLIMVERFFGVPIFNPHNGGDPLLFQHLFWFYSHPAVYIMILPAMGVISEVVTCFARRRVFGYTGMVYALLAIAVIGFMVWGHHMFVAGQSPYANLVFSFLSFIVAVPSAIKVFNWTATLYRGQISFEAAMLYAMGFIGLFTIGGLTGLFLASVPIDIQATDTYFVIAHFHFIMVGGSVTAFFAGIHYWWPKITGKMYSEIWARVAAVTMFLGFMLTFLPQFVMGWMGMPRRYHVYPEVFQIWHVMSTGGAAVLAVAYILPLIYLPLSLLRGPRAPRNPWGATGFEWQTTSPPPTRNFERTPVVHSDPYHYHEPGDSAGEHDHVRAIQIREDA